MPATKPATVLRLYEFQPDRMGFRNVAKTQGEDLLDRPETVRAGGPVDDFPRRGSPASGAAPEARGPADGDGAREMSAMRNGLPASVQPNRASLVVDTPVS